MPYTTDFTSFTYKMVDHPTAGMVYDNTVADPPSLSMSSGTATIDDVTLPTAPVAANNDIVFDFKSASLIDSAKFPAGATIKLTYKVKLTAVSSDTWKKQSNSATLQYSDNPTVSTSTTTLTATATDIAMYSVTLTNVDKDGVAINAKGKFKIYPGDDNSGTPLNFKTNGSTYIYDGSGTTSEITTDSAGKIVFDGLPAGNYYLEQTASGTGLTRSSFKFSIKANVPGDADENIGTDDGFFTNAADTFNLVTKNSLQQESSNHYNGVITIKNIDSLAGLPLTGGVGVALVVLLAIISGGVVVVTSKMRRKNLANARK